MARAADVEEKQLPQDMAEGGVTIRWLLGPEGQFNFYMRLFRMPPGSWIKAHHHPWEHEIFILSGSGKVRIGGKTYSVEEGYYMYIPPNVEHEYWAGDGGMSFLCMIPSKPTVEGKEKKC